MRLILILLCATVCAADAPNTSPWPLWDGVETVEQYAQRVKLPATKSLDLGGGVKLDLVLIPAGKFIMGEPKPELVDEEGFQKKIVLGQAILTMGGGLLLILLGVVLLRALRYRSRPRFSLALFLGMTAAAGIALLGGMHWQHSALALAEAPAKYQLALLHYHSAHEDQKPAHKVMLTTPFYMGKFTVTQKQFQQVLGMNPSNLKGENNPVENVSWDHSQEFCKHLSGKSGPVRLPTEAEWEYACRAGTRTNYYSGDTDKDMDRVGWHRGNSNGTTHPVGQKEPNRFGLYDMHGNVWQWCQDWYDKAYTAEAVADPQGPSQGVFRVIRGGCWEADPLYCRSAWRESIDPITFGELFGFRVVAEVPRKTP